MGNSHTVLAPRAISFFLTPPALPTPPPHRHTRRLISPQQCQSLRRFFCAMGGARRKKKTTHCRAEFPQTARYLHARGFYRPIPSSPFSRKQRTPSSPGPPHTVPFLRPLIDLTVLNRAASLLKDIRCAGGLASGRSDAAHYPRSSSPPPPPFSLLPPTEWKLVITAAPSSKHPPPPRPPRDTEPLGDPSREQQGAVGEGEVGGGDL